ncbi:unnamed protein product [Closterium sp. NIES-64]|nr:unnamed protein product [Closterium sp. NIES-65]CAI5965666.1 unnamed protein product [Closterium sp. NIES-64]CAI5994798.1 unnamed protein product [Closterium sp. NIES-64]
MLSMIKASASSAAPPPPKADDDDEPLSPTGQVACTLSVFASRLPPLITSFASHRHNNSQENLASLRSAYNASFSRTPPSTTTPSCIPPLFSPLSASLAASSRRGSLSPTPSPSASPSPSPTRSPSASPSASPLPLSPLSKTTPNLRPFPAANVRRSTTDTTGPASGSSSSSGSRNVSAEINITSGSSSSGGSSGVIAGGNRGTDSRKVAGAAPAAGENQSGMQVRSRSFNGNVDGPVSPLAASPVPVSPLSARFEPSRRNEFSRRDDSIGSATCIYAHAHTFTSANPPLSSSGPRSASLERSPESYGVKSAVSNADMYAFCPLAVASSTPGRRPPRRGPGGSGSFSGRYARSPSPQRAAQPAAPVEPLRLGPLIVAIGQADVTAIRDAVKAVRAAIKATPENKKRLIQAGGVQFLINLVAESPDGDTVEHAVTVLYNVCREEGGRDAIVSGAEGGLEALVKALRAEKSAARENAAAALFCLAWGIQTVSSSGNGGGKGGRGSRGPSPSRPTRGRSTSVGAVSMSPSVSARSSPHTPSLPPSPALKSPTASTTLLRPSYDSREFSGVFSGAGNSPSQPEGALQAAAGVSYATAGAGEEAGSTEAAAAGEGAAATAGVGATAGAADATAGAADATAGAANATAGAANATAGGADAMADGAGEQGKLESTPPHSPPVPSCSLSFHSPLCPTSLP